MMKIKNFDQLAVSDTRKAVLYIAEAGLAAIDTERVVRAIVHLDGNELNIGGRNFDAFKLGKIVVCGVGKCALAAAETLEKILGDRISGGVILYVVGEPRLKKIKAIKGTHPLPSEENILGAKALVGALGDLKEDDLVIFIVSGGGSTLLCLPEDGSCGEEASILKALTRAGATIQEINTVRKHLSLARGGYLAKYAYPARAVSLVFSDVPGDDMEFIASGPTIKDTTTIKDAEKVLSKYKILKTCGIEKCGLVETPKDGKYFAKVENMLAVSNKVALAAMQTKAEEMGFLPEIRETKLAGEASVVGMKILGEIKRAPPKSVFLYGGETTVTVRGKGHGGRNLELALSLLDKVGEGELIMTVASDGHDNGEYAGAICDKITKKAADAASLDAKAYLANNDAYPFFEKVGNYLMTGDTGSNVSDLIIAIKS